MEIINKVDVLLINVSEDAEKNHRTRVGHGSHKGFVESQLAAGLAMAQSPHIGLAYLLAITHKNEMDGHIIDMAADDYAVEDILDYVDKHMPKIIGMTAFTIQVKSAGYIASKIKERHPDIIIVLGGAHATAMPVEALEEFSAFDCTVPGEGDVPWYNILNNMHTLSSIPGVVTRENYDKQYVNKTVHSTPIKQIVRIEDLNEIPFPRWEGFNLSRYAGDCPHGTKLELPMSTSRGCPYKCNFCSRMFGRKRKSRSIDSIIEEMHRNVDVFGAEAIAFLDETFVASKNFSRELFQRMIDEGLNKKVKWSCETTVHLDDPEFYALMKRAGCYYVFYGFESGNAEMLKRIGKGVHHKSQIVKATKAAHSAGIVAVGSFILGLPGETEATVMESIEVAKTLYDHVYSITFPIAVPFPGTLARTYAETGEFGLKILTNDWDFYGKQYPGVMDSDVLSIDRLRELQAHAYEQIPKKNLDEFLHLKSQQA